MASLNAHNDLADTGRGILKLLSRPQDVAVAVGRFLKPEILSRQKSTTHRSDTAYLDGLRGSAALMVCFAHLTVYTHGNIELCAGHEVFPGVFVEPTPAQWPFLRLFFSGGQFSVALFFCISGFVLTQRLISLLHHGHREDFVRSVHSSIFRRPFRLFLPVIWSTLALATFWHVTGWVTPWPARQPNIFLEYWAWVVETGKFIYFFRRGFLGTYYNVHTWTILVELQGSLFIFIWLFALHHLPSRSRILVTVAALFHLAFLSPGGWFACFFAGMLTGEMVLIYAENSVAKISLPWDRFLRALWARPALYHTVLHAMLVVGWYLACQPTADDTVEATLGDCHGWVTLSKLIPPAYDAKTYLVPPAYDAKLYRWFWLFFAAWLVMICARELRWFRYLLERSFPQYLGRISFALYLIHGPMIAIFSERLFWLTGVWKVEGRGQEDIDKFGHLFRKWYDASWWPFSDQGLYGLEPNYLFCAFSSIIVFLYVAEVGTKLFDTPSFHLSRWLYKTSMAL